MLYNKQHIKGFGKSSILLILCSFIFVASCKKENLDYEYDYRRNTEASEASNVRLINLSTNGQLVVNGDSLTNFFLPPVRPGYIPPEETTAPGTHYFPKNGRLELVWEMPQDLFRADGTAAVKTTSPFISDQYVINNVEFIAEEELDNPKDYYLLIQNDDLVEWTGERVVEVPRSISAPSKADHFKIRVVNLAAKPTSTNSPMENLLGPMTLAYADGTPVSSTTSNIQPAAWSDYVEVPYGTYQFKLLTADGRQVPSAEQGSRIHPATSTLSHVQSPTTSAHLTFATVQTFQPGGVYTIVVHPKYYTWRSGQDDVQDMQNGFRIIADIDEPQNRTYTRVQMANALPGSELTFKVNGENTAGNIAEGEASGYLSLVAGSRELVVQDANGQTLASTTETLKAGGNHTLWVYPDQEGKATAVLVDNNLSGSWFTGNDNGGGNAEVDRRAISFPFDFRFLNLSPDIPYLTVTDGHGLPFGSIFSEGSGSNLQPGLPLIHNPYTRVNFDAFPTLVGYPARNITEPYRFLASASAPGRLPGDWIQDIPYLSSEALVAKPSLYTQANRLVPVHEPGVYTIALTGRHGQGNNQAKFMVVKHTK